MHRNKTPVRSASMVMSTRPYTDAHAIARLDFALIFTSELEDEAKARLGTSLEAHLKPLGLDPVGPEDEEDGDLDDDEGALAFARKGEDDRVAEEVHVHENYVHVIWSDYRGWVLSRDGALERLAPVLDLIRSGALEVGAVGLAYRDVFLTDEASSFDAEALFRTVEGVVPPFLLRKGAKWRHWSGWAEPVVAGDRWRNTCMLGIDVGERSQEDGPAVHVTEVIHRQRLSTAQDGGTVAVDDLSALWDEAHNQNRWLVQRLVGDVMLELIGLKEGPNEHAMR